MSVPKSAPPADVISEVSQDNSLPRFSLLRDTIDAVSQLVKQADKFDTPVAEALFEAIDQELIASSNMLHEMDCDLLRPFRIVLRMAKNEFDKNGDEDGFKQSVKNIF